MYNFNAMALQLYAGPMPLRNKICGEFTHRTTITSALALNLHLTFDQNINANRATPFKHDAIH